MWDVSDLGEWVNGELGEDAVGGLWAEGVEGLERCLQEFLLGEVDAKDEDLGGALVKRFEVGIWAAAACAERVSISYHDYGVVRVE